MLYSNAKNREQVAKLCLEKVGLGDRLGTVEQGKWADLIVVDKDPLADIRHLRHPRFVLRGGVTALDELAAGGDA